MGAADLVSLYLRERSTSWSPLTLDHTRRALDQFLRFSLFADLSHETVLAFVAHARSRPAPTEQWLLGALLAFLRWAVSRGYLLADLGAGIRLPHVEALPRALSEDAARLLIESGPKGPCALRDRAIFETLYGTGLRISELARLDVADVSLAEGLAFVRQGKGSKDRVVPFGARVRAALVDYLRHERASRGGALFLSWSGTRLTVGGLQQIIRRARARAGLEGATAHGLRHSYATHLLRHGADVRHIQVLLGHASLCSTQIYLETDVADLRRMLEGCHPRERGEGSGGGRP
jgi:site-specific recombinase XerD